MSTDYHGLINLGEGWKDSLPATANRWLVKGSFILEEKAHASLC